MAAKLRVEGQRPRITTSERDGRVVYRVIMGPFPSRSEAERIARASGQTYWIFEGVP
jgi:cell division protein FtsN